ncbi:hypothetical protein [Shewanella sp.]|uniref:hypothetical protein n=1 Tax=Shewanella sp. TaxID=50422 RepID=UPI004054105C
MLAGIISRATNNPYTSNIYRFWVLEYWQETFSYHFGSSGKSHSGIFFLGEGRRSPDQEQTPLEKIGKALIEEYSKHKNDTDAQKLGVPALLWVKFLYIKNKFESIDMDEHKDFVESASPLDWMGKDELSDLLLAS